MTYDMTREDIWVAGYLSDSGTITVIQGPHPAHVRLTAQSTRNNDALVRFSRYVDVNLSFYHPRHGKEKVQCAVRGRKLHDLMYRVWDELSTFQRRRYREALEKAQALRVEQGIDFEAIARGDKKVWAGWMADFEALQRIAS